MAAKVPRGLGMGFDSLIPTTSLDDDFDPTLKEDNKLSALGEIPIDTISPDSDQPRQKFDEDELQELADSIREYGVLQPIILIKKGNGYQIVAGERRWRAANLAGLKTMPALVRTLDAQNQLEVSLIENLQRTDLNAMEVATAYRKLREQFNMTLEQVSQRVNKSVPSIVNTMRLLKLPKQAQQAIADGLVTEGQMRPLVNESAEVTMSILPSIITEGWSARKVEQYVVNLRAGDTAWRAPSDNKKILTNDSRATIWREKLGTPDISVRTNRAGGGAITIRFKDADELDRLEHLLD